MPQTIVEKIAQAHLADGPNRPVRAGDFVSIRPFHVMTHDNTAAVISKFKAIGAKRIFNPKQLIFALDHDIQNHDETNLKKYHSIESFAAEHGADFYPVGAGIGHQLMVERDTYCPGLLSSLQTRIRTCTAPSAPSALPSSVQMQLVSGLPENSGGKFHAPFGLFLKASCQRG